MPGAIRPNSDIPEPVSELSASTPVGQPLDETYIRVKGQWKYLYRAVDNAGHSVDFLLTAKRDRKAALRFRRKAIDQSGLPEKITIEMKLLS